MFNAMYRRGITVTNNHSVPFRHFAIYTFLPPPQRRVWKGVKKVSKDTVRDELRARFTVYISQVIIHAKLDYIRQLKRRAQEIYLEDLEMEPSVDFEEQYTSIQQQAVL